MRFVLVLAPVLGCLVASVCIDLTEKFHQRQQGDTLMPVLGSLYACTLFVWEQNRVGMFVPLLATPFEHPLTNLLVQNGITIFGGLASLGVFAWYVLRDRTAAVIGLAGAALFLMAAPERYRFFTLNWLLPYLIPFAMALLAVPLATPRDGLDSFRAAGRMALADDARGFVTAAVRYAPRLLVALVVTGLAYWSNVGTAVAVAPVLVGRFLVAGRTARSRAGMELATGLILTVVGTQFGRELAYRTPYRNTDFSFAPITQWPEGWKRLAANTWPYYGSYLTTLGALTLVGLLWLALPRTRAAAARVWLVLGVGVASLAAQFGVVGTTSWLRMNEFDIRYLVGVLAVLSAGVAGVALGPPLALLPPARLRLATVALSLMLPAVAVWQFGLPSVASARAGVDRATGPWTQDILDARCTHLIGNYWSVWPAVYHANLTLADRGEAPRVWGVVLRSEPTQPRWGPTATQARIGWLIDMPATHEYSGPTTTPHPEGRRGVAATIFPKIRKIERRPTLWVCERDEP